MITEAALLARVKSLPSFPTAVVRLREVLAQDRSTPADVERAVAVDAALTANLLRIANSARFGLRRQVASVGHAVTLLGRGRLQEIVLGEALRHVAKERIPGFEMTPAAFFSHCVATAVVAGRITAQRGAGRDAGFLGGLLHDVGKLAIGAFLEAAGADLRCSLGREGMSLFDAERETLGTDHAQAGALLAEHWALPPVVVSVTRWHHEPDRAPSDAAQVVDAVHLANALAHAFGFGADVGELRRRPEPSAVRRLGFTLREVEVMASESLEEIVQTTALFTEGMAG